LYWVSAAVAAATSVLATDVWPAAVDPDELDEPDEPHAASATLLPIATIPATNRRERTARPRVAVPD
jgi:hypothetical protein